MHKIVINNSKIYMKNLINENIFSNLTTNIYDHVFVITEETVFNIYQDHEIFHKGFKVVNIKQNQPIKTLETSQIIINELSNLGCTRKSLIIGFGGGVIMDFSGFIASIYMRGIDHIFIPTTLLGMVDAAIGGKTGVNTKFSKNLIGTFKNPEYIYIDSIFLNSLNKKDMIDGFAEIIKYGLIKDKDLFFESVKNFKTCINHKNSKILDNLIKKCCKHKIDIVEQDQFEKNHRMILNFGHTIGHALEKCYNYEHLTHGQAVYYGMNAINFISWKLNYITDNQFKIIDDFIKQVPLFDIGDLKVEEVMKNLKFDKKQTWNKNQFILLNDLGSCFITNKVDNAIVKQSLDFIIN